MNRKFKNIINLDKLNKIKLILPVILTNDYDTFLKYGTNQFLINIIINR